MPISWNYCSFAYNFIAQSKRFFLFRKEIKAFTSGIQNLGTCSERINFTHIDISPISLWAKYPLTSKISPTLLNDHDKLWSVIPNLLKLFLICCYLSEKMIYNSEFTDFRSPFDRLEKARDGFTNVFKELRLKYNPYRIWY